VREERKRSNQTIPLKHTGSFRTQPAESKLKGDLLQKHPANQGRKETEDNARELAFCVLKIPADNRLGKGIKRTREDRTLQQSRDGLKKHRTRGKGGGWENRVMIGRW
jgi:hypothetical protein